MDLRSPRDLRDAAASVEAAAALHLARARADGDLPIASSWLADRSATVYVVVELRAFVIMPFDPEFDAVYTDLIAPPLQDAGFVVQRADDVADRQNVMVDVVRGIAEADLVIADLTTANANVFYELGLAHAMGVPTILIAHQASAEDIPFDLRQYRTEFYETHFQRAKIIVGVLGKLAVSHAAGQLTFGSPISDFLPGARRPALRSQRTGAVGASAPSDASAAGAAAEMHQHEAGHPDESDDLGFLDFNDALTEAADEVGAALEPINAATELYGSAATALSKKMNSLGPATVTPAQAKRLLLQAAGQLNKYADSIETGRPLVEAAVDKVTSNGLGYLTLLAEKPKQYRDQLIESLEAMVSLRDSVGGAAIATSGMSASLAELPSLLKETNRARNRAVRAIDSMLSQLDRVRSYAEQAIGLIESALESAG
jgi:hypothetical protein